MKKNIRSQYIKNLLEDKDELKDQLKEVTKDTLKSVLDENLSHSLRNIISESEDEPEEDEVDTDALSVDNDPEEGGYDDADMEASDKDEDNEMWDSLEEYKDENGEYDLTGMGKDAIAMILSKMKPDEGVHVVKNDDGTASVSTDDDDTEFVIDIDDDAESDFEEENGMNPEAGADGDPDEDETMFEIEDSDDDDDETLGEGEIHDYDPYYQHKTAMTIDSNEETAPNKHSHMDWDKGVRSKGTGRRWVGQGNMSPYSEKVTEEYVLEMDDVEEPSDDMSEEQPMANESFELVYEDGNEDGPLLTDGEDYEEGYDDDPRLDYLSGEDYEEGYDQPEESIHTVAQNGPHRRGTTKSWVPDTSRSRHIGRNYSVAGTHKRCTGDASYQGVGESVKRKINDALEENRQLKKIAKQFKDRLNEQVVITSSLGKIVKLVTENSTSRDEKLDIVRRFNNAKSVNDTERIYESIDNELKRTVRNSNPMSQNKVNISEAKNRNNIVETQMYQSDDLSNTISLMNRLDKIK